jgi:nucleotide-binding universal stress UspA family protein
MKIATAAAASPDGSNASPERRLEAEASEGGAVGNLVVVGVDGSSSSLSAVEAAAGEAQRRRAELRVVHAFSRPVRPMYAPLGPSPLNRLVHEAAQHAQNVAPEMEVTEAVMTGDAVAVLEAESRAADLVVVGSRGMGGFIGMLLESTAVSLAAHGRCPVMVVREEQAGAGPIVLGVDGSPVGEKAVDFAFAEAALRGAEIVAVHAWLPDHAPLGTGPESPSVCWPTHSPAARRGIPTSRSDTMWWAAKPARY